MRAVLVRDANLAFAIAAVLLMGTLGGVGWNRSAAVQGAREATIHATDESRLLEALREAESATDRARLDYLSNPRPAGLTALRDSIAAVHRLDRQIEQTAAHDQTDGTALIALARAVDARTSATEQGLAEQNVAGPPVLADILPRVTAAARAAQQRRMTYIDVVTKRLRVARWLAAAVALLGIGCVVGLVHQLGRAWRRLRQAELESRSVASQLRASLDSLSQGVAVFSGTGALVNWNLRLGQLLDLPPGLLEQGLAYHALEQGLTVADGPFLEPISTILADAPSRDEIAPIVYERTRYRAHAGSEPQPDAAAEAVAQLELRRTLMPQGGFVLTVTDITERVQSERLLRDTQKMQALGQLTGGIAHDFNNMLTVIMGSLEVTPAERAMPDGQLTRRLMSRIDRASQAAGSGAALTRQLLTFARKQSLAPVPANLSGILPDLMPLIQHTVGDPITVTFDIEPGLWPALVDVGQLQSAVLNLALNARDAMPQGGHLIISAGNLRNHPPGAQQPGLPPDLPSSDYVRISVADTGNGMSPEVIARAFEPFFTTKAEGHGTGLGLAMVFSFAAKSGGRAMIQSEPGFGTKISLVLPRTLIPPAAARDVDLGADLREVPCAPSADCHILLVDDELSVREVTAETLRGLGYRVSEARNAPEALDQVKVSIDASGRFDLLVTDIALHGGMDGKALADCIGRLCPATPVLFMSGSLDRSSAEPADDQLAQWLSKPFRRRQLAEAVDSALNPPGRSAPATNGTLAASSPSL